MTDIDFKTPSDKEWLIQFANALDAAERIHPNVIQMSDELARQAADRLRAIHSDAYENEAIIMSTEEFEAIYNDDVFEAMELQEKLG